jgi:hypothetical protein
MSDIRAPDLIRGLFPNGRHPREVPAQGRDV